MNTDIIFDTLDEAVSHVLHIEDQELEADRTRTDRPFVISPHRNKTTPLKLYPGVAFWNNANERDYILTKLQSGRFSLKPNLKKRKFLFRGQTEFYPNCIPSLFRVKKNRYTVDITKGMEMMLLMLSHPLVRLLDNKINLLGHNFTFEMNLYGLTQHYYNKTCFIDLTSDINVACFFATNQYNSIQDIYTPIIDENKTGVLYYYDIDSSHGFSAYGLSTIGLQVFPRSGCQSGFLQQIGLGMDFNQHPKMKWVKFRHNASVSERYSKMFNQGVELFPHDILEHHWKNRNENVISDRSVLMNMIYNQFSESKSKLMRDFSDAGVSISKYPVLFTPDELHEYYQDIKNGFWEEWCKRIYINGDRNDAFKNALLSLSKDSHYDWAFKEKQNASMPTNGYWASIYAECLK